MAPHNLNVWFLVPFSIKCHFHSFHVKVPAAEECHRSTISQSWGEGNSYSFAWSKVKSSFHAPIRSAVLLWEKLIQTQKFLPHVKFWHRGRAGCLACPPAIFSYIPVRHRSWEEVPAAKTRNHHAPSTPSGSITSVGRMVGFHPLEWQKSITNEGHHCSFRGSI